MSKIRVAFLGTPEFAVTCLKTMVADEHIEIVGVVTQPDRPSGRKMQLQPSAVKNYCLNQNIKVISPDTVNSEIILSEIATWNAEVAVVVAFGQLLSEKFLKIFPLGAVNVHASLLPRWRGAAPIQRSIEFGDAETGVCLQKIVKKLDAGDVLGFRKLKISEELDAQALHDQLAILGSDMLQVELMDYLRGNLIGLVQDETQVTYAKKIDKNESQINWNLPAKVIFNKIKAFTMGPGTWTYVKINTQEIKESAVAATKAQQPVKLKIHKAKVINDGAKGVEPGQVIMAEGEECLIGTQDGILQIIEVQPESRNRMAIKDYIKGYGLKKGDLLF